MTSTPRPQRPARRRLSEDERRAQILRSTIEVVADQGFEAATASNIAAHAGLSKGLIWHYFTDKVELMRAAVVHTVSSLTVEIAASIDEAAPVPERIRAYVHAVAAAHAKRADEFRAMNSITSKLVRADGTPAFGISDYEPLFRGQEAIFRRGQEAGDLRDFDTRVMAVTYQSSVDGMLSYLDAHPEVDGDAYADELAEMLIAAMVKTE